MSQSLFYWNPFCNIPRTEEIEVEEVVAILILVESFLQCEIARRMENSEIASQSLFYWNPFCNNTLNNNVKQIEESQSLFYWNPFCNREKLSLSSSSWRSQSLFYWNPFCNMVVKMK